MKIYTYSWFWSFGLALLVATLLSTKTLAQSKGKPYIANVRVEVDSVAKRVKFKYDLLRAEPEDSIYVQIETQDNVFYLRSVQGEIGKNLSPGYDKIFFWNPLADHRKLNEKVNVSFVIKTFSTDDSLSKRRGLVFTKRQIVDYSRWAISAGLTGITIAKGLALRNDINVYNQADPPTNASDKIGTDQRKEELEAQKRQFYPWVAVSGASILINAVYSLVRPKPRQSLQGLRLEGQGSSVSLVYHF